MKITAYLWFLLGCLVHHTIRIHANGRLTVSIWYLWGWIVGVLNSFAVFLQPESGSYRLCLGDSFEVNCTAQNATVICWDLSIPGPENFAKVCFYISLPTKELTTGPFSLSLLSKDPLMSTANLSSVGIILNETVLTCSSSLASSLSPNQISDIVIILEGKLATFFFVLVY